jgi:3',5'-cyclic AMP phosphodiesterase CpdA
MFRLAHISDLHLFNLRSIKLSKFLSRRIIGALNLLVSRQSHSEIALKALVSSLEKENCDHVIITGDVSNFALDEEFEFIRGTFADFWKYEKLTILPGNHDFYTAGAFKTRRFEKNFAGILGERDVHGSLFPVIKNLKEVIIACLNSTMLSLPVLSCGRVPEDQLGKLKEVSRTRKANTCLIVALHHNLHRRSFFSEVTGRLLNREQVMKTLAEAHADLILHGHSHTGQAYFIKHGGSVIPVICAGSATYLSKDPVRNARYNIYTVENGSFRSQTKVYDHELKEFV